MDFVKFSVTNSRGLEMDFCEADHLAVMFIERLVNLGFKVKIKND